MKVGYGAMKRRKVTVTLSEATLLEAAEALQGQLDYLDSLMLDATPDHAQELRQSRRDVARAAEELRSSGVSIFGVKGGANMTTCEACGLMVVPIVDGQAAEICDSCEARR